MSSSRPNFRLHENENVRCATCAKVAYSDAPAAFCMAGIDSGKADDGQRVNENFVCDDHSAK